ncbi:MAG: AEC family transporter [Butyrivibrio sp.]|nr:AEC family transporter [Butyrivibrio sp.]
MENFIFSINATFPIFILMLLGLFFRKIGLIKEDFTAALNKFVFKAALPVLLFQDLSVQNFSATWNGKFVLFCFVATLLSVLLITLLSFLLIHENAKRGEFIQVSYRSSAALLGIAFIQNIYGKGNTGMAPLMILGSVPLYNIFAVVILTLTGESRQPGQKKFSHALITKTLYGIISNPIIIGILVGFIWSILKIPQPPVFSSTIQSIAALATPLGLMAMGSAFDLQKAKAEIAPAIAASVIKLILLVAVFLPLAVLLGFRNQELVALLVMLGSASTVSCYIMARNMGHDGTLTASTIMMTTFGCAFTLTFWLYLLRSLHLI